MHKSSSDLDVCIIHVTSSFLDFSLVVITPYAPFTMLYFFLDISIHVGPIKTLLNQPVSPVSPLVKHIVMESSKSKLPVLARKNQLPYLFSIH